jgi:hypothetical protein
MSLETTLKAVWSATNEDQCVTDASRAMQAMRKRVKSLHRDADREHGHSNMLSPTRDLMMKAALVWTLSDCIDLALLFVHRWQTRWQGQSSLALQQVSRVDIQFRSAELMMDPSFIEARVNLKHPWREEVDIFLMESLLRDFVAMQSDRDLSVPLSALVQKFTNMWRHRPIPPRMQKVLEQLGNSKYAAKWAWNFRRRWKLGMQKPSNRQALSRTSLQSKVSVTSNVSSQLHGLQTDLHVFTNTWTLYTIQSTWKV